MQISIPVPTGEAPVIMAYSKILVATPIIKWMYLSISIYSLLVSFWAKSAIYTIPIYYLIVYCAFYLWHWQAHHLIWWIPFNKACYKKHKEHHFVTYPSYAFFGKTNKITGKWLQYFTPTEWISHHEALLYVFMSFIIFSGYEFFHTSVKTMIGAVVGFIITGVIGNYLHHCYHIKGHWLEGYAWFHELRALHYAHHLKTAKQNYGILNMSLDKLLCSFAYDA